MKLGTGADIRQKLASLVRAEEAAMPATGVWVATGFAAGLIFLPRTTRVTIGSLAALAGADLLQYLHAWAQQQTS